MKKLNTEEFINRAIKIHGEKYDYSLINYINGKLKVKIICKTHGLFEQEATSHLSGNGCSKCAGVGMDSEYFIEKAEIIHNNEYDYSLVKYCKSNKKVKINCKIHGVFEQTPNSHLDGSGCPKCYGTHIYSNDEYVEKANKVHNNRYDYSKLNYVNSETKVNIICSKHGMFEQFPTTHLSGQGCSKCIGRNKTTDEIIRQFEEKHADRYDYSQINYVDSKTKIKIICKEHGEFFQTVYLHLSGQGCPKCVGRNKTTEDFINEAIKIHGNKFDYSLVNYEYNNKNVKIVCPVHDIFEQLPASHLIGCGCPKCMGRNKTTEEFIKEANLIHNNKYEYTKTIYLNAKSKVIIACPKHGDFLQKVNNHLNGSGCPICSGSFLDQELFIEKAREKHGDKYNYNKTVFVDTKQKVIITCPKHGEFKQTPNGHLRGAGCSTCKKSKGEMSISKFLIENNINYIQGHKFNDCKHIFSLSFDFYLPDYNILIEYDGEQHFRQVKYFGGEKGFQIGQKRDGIKNEYCENNKIPLIRIKYNEKIENALMCKLLPLINKI